MNNHKRETQLSTVREYKVVKANDFIQKTRYNLSTQEQKIILYLITKIKPEDSEFQLYEFKIKEFCTICGIDDNNGKNYANLKNTIKKLADKSFWITIDEKGTETLFRWIDRPYINVKSGTIKIKLDELMKPYLLQLQTRFTEFSLYYTLAMKSQYSIRLYELLRSFENLGGWTFTIDELKKRLYAETYDRYPDFKRKVIDIAMREINNFSDISVTYELEKQGRKYHRIRFIVKLKKDLKDRLETWEKIDKIISPNKKTLSTSL